MRKRTHKRQQAQSDVIEALAGGASVPEAAEAGGVHRSTVYRWSHDPDFARQLRKARGDAPKPKRPAPSRARRDRFRDHPDVQPAREEYVNLAREHHGDVPIERFSGVPDPRWWLVARESGDLHPDVEAARLRYREARDRVLHSWRRERDAEP